jgi:hypothetical protein
MNHAEESQIRVPPSDNSFPKSPNRLPATYSIAVAFRTVHVTCRRVV